MLDHIKEVFLVAFSKAHLNDSSMMYPIKKNNHREVVQVIDKKISNKALIILSVATLGVGWLIYDLYTANRKVKRIHQDHLNLSSILLSKQIKDTAITYELSGGRLGDNLMCFLAAYYVAYKNNLPFYYKPFENSDQFLLSEKLPPLATNFSFKNKVEYKDWGPINNIEKMGKETSTLVTIQPFADVRPNWEEPGFKNAVRELIQLKEPIIPLALPQDRIPLALHVRTGGGFATDTDAEKRRVPAKFPPREFYLQGLQEMTQAYGKDEKFYVHIFTDDPNPAKIAEEFKQQFPGVNIEFGYRKEENRHDVGVLDDFFGMTQFKGMIRPWSGLSQAAEIIGEQEMVYEPAKWVDPIREGSPVIVPGKLNNRREVA